MTPPALVHVYTLTVHWNPIIEMGVQGRRQTESDCRWVRKRAQAARKNSKPRQQRVFARGTAELETHNGTETEDGAIIGIVNFGYRHGPPDFIAALAACNNANPDTYDHSFNRQAYQLPLKWPFAELSPTTASSRKAAIGLTKMLGDRLTSGLGKLRRGIRR